MEEKDLKQIESVMTRMVDRFRSETVEAFDQRIGVLEESFQHKLDLVVDGQQMLVERMDRLDGRMDKLENRVDGIAVDLAAHRHDTEAHRKGWRVREEEGED